MREYIYEEIVDEVIIDGFDCSTVRIGEQREEIVRCRDCRWYSEGKKRGCIRHWVEKLPKSLLDYPILPAEPDGYCHRGERRKDA